MDEQLITPQALRDVMKSRDTLTIIDVRGDDAYDEGHIPGAIHIPGDQLATHLAEVPYNARVVTYCNMRHPGSSRSEQAAKFLRDQGFHAQALEGGFPAWKEAGFPVDEGQPAGAQATGG